MKRLIFAAALVSASVAVSHSVPGLDASQPAQTVTIPELLSAPFPTNLTAAPAGGAVAWVFNDRGSRNVWIATPPDYRGRPLTTYPGDDGQEIGDLSWTPDAGTILYVRGGGSNRQGEYPNPQSDPDGVEQAIWAVTVDGGAPRKIAAGAAPAIAPKGNRVAYILRNQAWWIDLADGAKPERFLEGRGQASALRWSPDGSKLAFVSGRGDHAFVGVYDIATKASRGSIRASIETGAPSGRRMERGSRSFASRHSGIRSRSTRAGAANPGRFVSPTCEPDTVTFPAVTSFEPSRDAAACSSASTPRTGFSGRAIASCSPGSATAGCTSIQCPWRAARRHS